MALKSYWINKHINSGKRLYFSEIFLPKFVNSINNHFIISEHFDLKNSFSQTPVSGLFKSIFDPNQNFFTSLDLAVAINISVNGYCNPKYVYNDAICNSANFICEELKSRIYDDKILKEYLSEMDKKLTDFEFRVDKHVIKDTLSNKLEIFRTYYSKFENKDYTTSITVYHQSASNTWIDWNDENSITINHSLIKFNEGFFLIGFDYRLSTGEHLNIAASIDGYEYFNPENYDWNKNVLWAS